MFRALNLVMVIDYTFDEEDNRVGMAVGVTAYGPNCEWDPVDTTSLEAPIIEGKATHQGVLIGSGLCKGAQWVYQNTWDVEAHTVDTTGVVEPVPEI